MRRRDRIYFGVLAALCVMHALGIGSSVAFYWWASKRLASRVALLESGLEAEARTRADGIAAARAALASAPSVEDSSTEPAETPPRVVGYGQTRSKGAYYVYADYEYADGTMQRRYIQRIPFQTSKQ